MTAFRGRHLICYFGFFIACAASQSQNITTAETKSRCPIVFEKVDPHSYPFTSEMLGSGKDPWDHYLRIEYKNIADKRIVGIRFGVAFIDALADLNESVYAYTSDEVVKPDKTTKPYWGDGVYFHQYGNQMGAIAWVEKVRFADNTFFLDNGQRSCSSTHNSSASNRESSLNQDRGFTANPLPAAQSSLPPNVIGNSEAAKESPAAAAELANSGHIRSPEELADLVRTGLASKCAVVTFPPGAQVKIDGNSAGISPLAFVLLKQGDHPRTITISMDGYETVERTVTPDGKTIPIGIALKKH